MKKIGIIGSRRRNTKQDFEQLREVFLSIYEEGDVIVSGGCKQGGDKFAEEIAEELGLTIDNEGLIIHYPDKSKLDPEKMKKNPRWAYAEINYGRNTLIAQDSDVLLSVVASDRKGGTEDTIKKATKMGKTIILVEDKSTPEDFDPLDIT